MRIKVITPPQTEPVDANEVKAQLGISTDDISIDEILTRRITAARSWVEEYCERSLINQTLEIRLDTFPADGNIQLPWPEAVSITSVKYISALGVETTISAGAYSLDTYASVLRPVYGAVWPVPRAEPNAVRIQWVAGYGTGPVSIPPAIIDCIINIVGHWTNYQSQIEHGGTITQVPGAIRKLLDQYRTRFI